MTRDDVLNFITSRRSVRKFTEEAVCNEDLMVILKSAMAAPSARNDTPWDFVVVKERDLLNKLAEAHPYGKMLGHAPMAIAVVGSPKVSDWWLQDCSAATENILLAVSGLGLGAVWLGVYPREERAKAVGDILSVPDDMFVLSLIAIGHPVETPVSRTQYKENKVHYGKW